MKVLLLANSNVMLEPETAEDLAVLAWMNQQRDLSFSWADESTTKGASPALAVLSFQ